MNLIKSLYKNFTSFRKFLNILIGYTKLNARLILKYIFVLISDSIAKMFSVVAIIPLVDFLSDSGSAESQKVTLFFTDVLSFAGLEYTLGTSIAVFIFAVLLALLTEVLFYFISRKNAYNLSHYFSHNGLRSFFNRGLKFINSKSFGTLQNTFQREIEQISNGIDGILIMISSIVQMFFLLFLAFSLSAYMTTVTLIIMTIVFVIMSNLNLLVSKFSARTTSSSNDLSHALLEPLLNSKQILSFGRSEYATTNFSKKFNKHVVDALLSQTLAFSIPLIFRTLGIIATLVALYLSLSRGESTATLIAALIALIRITPIASQITLSIALVNTAVPSLNQFEKLFGYIDKRRNSVKLNKFTVFSKAIKLNNVSYSHDISRGLISNINLIIKKNSYVSFVGASGSGKTTCVDLIIGLLKPHSGSVLIDGAPLEEFDSDSFLNHVGYVQQTPFLFNGSIRENLLWSNFDATEKEMWDALRLAKIDDYIRSTKHQLDTSVGDRGVSLSGGQKQRIVLAQALIRKPDILILDEATNSLDPESERSIMDALKDLAHKITIISITHRPVMTKNSDQIYVFNNGGIVEYGIYDDLMSDKTSLFYNMNRHN